jgi:hypothetical protein
MMSELRFVIKWGLGLGLLVGAALCLLFVKSRTHLSRKDVYDRIYVGMLRQEAVETLRSGLIECGLTEPESETMSCHFSDIWHLYIVGVDLKTKRVGRKVAAFRKPGSLLDLLRSLHKG